jgi:hypothetical protein
VTLKGVEPKVRADLDLHKFRTYRGHVNIKKTLRRKIAARLANDEDHAKLNAKRKASNRRSYLERKARLTAAHLRRDDAKAKAASRAAQREYKDKKDAGKRPRPASDEEDNAGDAEDDPDLASKKLKVAAGKAKKTKGKGKAKGLPGVVKEKR